MYSIFGKKVGVFFGKITNWGTFNDETFNLLKIWDKNHPEYSLFINKLNKIALNPYVFHNMYELIDIKHELI